MMIDLDVIVEAEGWRAFLGAEPEAVTREALDAVLSPSSRPERSAEPGPRSEPRSILNGVPGLAALAREDEEQALAILFADDATLQRLNREFRAKDQPTNVLSFPAPPGMGALGDVALALETVAREAEEQGKSPLDHTRHMIVHGILHLMGYDHETDAEAAEMESLERAILAALGAPDPYE